jgi:hypothetical protein
MKPEDQRAVDRVKEGEKLIRRAEKALTEIKVAQGLSNEHASVLAALRIHLKGDPGKSLEDLLTAAGDLASSRQLEDVLQEPGDQRSKPSLDQMLSQKSKKRTLDDVLSPKRDPE